MMPTRWVAVSLADALPEASAVDAADAEPEDPHPAMERHIMEANTDAVNFFIVFIPLCKLLQH